MSNVDAEPCKAIDVELGGTTINSYSRAPIAEKMTQKQPTT